MDIAGPMRALVLLCWTSALCAANRPWSEDGGISWTGPDGARHVVKAAVRKWKSDMRKEQRQLDRQMRGDRAVSFFTPTPRPRSRERTRCSA